MTEPSTTPTRAADPADGMPPFPDHALGDVATIVGVCAALVQGDPDLRTTAIDTLAVNADGGGEWAAIVADSLAYVLRMCGADADELWAAYFAMSSEHADATAPVTPDVGVPA